MKLNYILKSCSGIAVLVSFLLLFPLFIRAQQSVEGVVVDNEGNPIKNVQIVFIDKERGTKFTVKSDKSGRFVKVGIPPAFYIISVEHEGYYPLESEFKVVIGRNQPMRLILEKKPLQVEIDPDIDLGGKLYEEGNYREAEIAFRRALERDPDSVDANYGLALSLMRLDKIDEAIVLLEKIKQKNENMIEVYLALGECYFLKQETDNALSCFNRALEIEPDNPEVFYNIGIIHYQNGQMNEAIQNFLSSKNLDPQFAAAYYQLGLSYIRNGETEKAVESLEEFLRLEPDTALAAQVEDILKELKNK